MTESSQFLVAFLVTSIALLSALLFFILTKKSSKPGKSVADLARDIFGRAKRPLLSLSTAIAFIVLLGYILPTEAMNRSAQVGLLVGFSALAIVPPWLPVRLFALATVVLLVASVSAFRRLLPENAEGPDVMALSVLLGFLYLMFFASCAVRFLCEAIGLYASRRSENQHTLSRNDA